MAFDLDAVMLQTSENYFINVQVHMVDLDIVSLKLIAFKAQNNVDRMRLSPAESNLRIPRRLGLLESWLSLRESPISSGSGVATDRSRKVELLYMVMERRLVFDCSVISVATASGSTSCSRSGSRVACVCPAFGKFCDNWHSIDKKCACARFALIRRAQNGQQTTSFRPMVSSPSKLFLCVLLFLVCDPVVVASCGGLSR